MEADEIRLSIVDQAGRELERRDWVIYSERLRRGEVIGLRLRGSDRERRFRVLKVWPGDGEGRHVQAIEVHR